MIRFIEGLVRGARHDSRRIELAAGPEPEKTWINHALITVILGGGLGYGLGLIFGIPHLGFKLGLGVALGCYLYREVRQWWGRSGRPSGFWWDACLDVAFPAWLCAYPLGGLTAFAVMTLLVALFHWGLRPVE